VQWHGIASVPGRTSTIGTAGTMVRVHVPLKRRASGHAVAKRRPVADEHALGHGVGEIIGQASALATVGRFLDDAAAGTAALLIEGGVGSGKSALWSATVAEARARGFTVLASRPVEAENVDVPAQDPRLPAGHEQPEVLHVLAQELALD